MTQNKNTSLFETKYGDSYTISEQQLIIGSLLNHPQQFSKLRNLMKEQYFDEKLWPTIKFLNKHFDQYGGLPSAALVREVSKDIPELQAGDINTHWLNDMVVQFARYKAHELAVLNGVDHLQSGRPDLILAEIQAAAAIAIGTTDAPFTSMWGDETDLVPPPTYLIRPWLVADTVTGVYGAPGSFKSFFCLQAALCMATGVPFNGHPVSKTSVAYIVAEGQGGIAMRIEAWQEHHGIKLGHTDLLTITQPVNLLDSASVATLIQFLRDREVEHSIDFGIVFIDTYSQCIAGADENSASVASAASAAMIRIRRELGAAVVFVHHTGKDKGRGMRGSDALRGNTDGAVEVDRPSDDSLAAVAKVVRHKDAPIGARIEFSMQVVPIPRLRGSEIDASLVCTFPAQGVASPAQANLFTKMAWHQIRRSILNVMQQGDVLSVASLTKKIGMHSTTTYKDKIADALPLDEMCEVATNAGEIIGTLRRTLNLARPDNTYGDIVCELKPAVTGGNNQPLFPDGLTH